MKTLTLTLLALLFAGCAGGGAANRAVGNIHVSAGDNAVITISRATASQEADKTVDAVKAAASAAQAQGGDAAGGAATVAPPPVTPEVPEI